MVATRGVPCYHKTMKNALLPTIYPVTCHTGHVGPGSTFVAISRGVSLIPEAIARGAKKVVLEKKSYDDYLGDYKEVEFVFVDNARESLSYFSSEALGSPSKKLKIIGITGTAGKTSTVFLINHILSYAGYKTALLGSIYNQILDNRIDSELTTHESDYLNIFFDMCVDREVEYVLMEVSSHAIAQKRVHGMSFDGIGFTNLSPEHMDFHNTMEQYFETKYKLFSQANNFVVINQDDEWGKKAIKKLTLENSKLKKVTFGVCDDMPVCPVLFGEYNKYNVCMASKICKEIGVNDNTISRALKNFTGIPGRLQMHMLKNGARAFVDFAHKPGAMEAVLKALRPLTIHLVVVFGCGGDRDKLKRPVMGKLASMYADYVIITDDNPRFENRNEIIKQIYDGVPEGERSKVACIPDRAQAIEESVKNSNKNSIIAILGKGHETYYLCNGEKFYFDDFEEIGKY